MSDETNVTEETTPTDNTNGGETTTTGTPATEETAPAQAAVTTPEKEKPAEETAKPEGAPEAYEMPPLPDGYGISDETRDAAYELGKKHNLPQGALNDMVSEFIKITEANTQASESATLAAWDKERGEWATSLKKEWGIDYEKNTDLVGKVIDKFAVDDEAKKYIESSAFKENPHIAKIFLEFGRKISPDSLELGQPQTKASKGLYDTFSDLNEKKQ